LPGNTGPGPGAPVHFDDGLFAADLSRLEVQGMGPIQLPVSRA